MVEDDGECILQWSGHAGYITERFSGLLARQALVDVTLICEEQKLRVHKLVLASNSAYFEELLEQDLGHEPIIFLRDLNFEILKAMVEFMYCGETTVSHERLPSLLAAAEIFKVKELAGIINTVTESDKEAEEFEGSSISPSDSSEFDQMDSSDENDCIHESCIEPDQTRCTQLCINTDKDMSLLQNSPLEDTVILDNPEQQLDHTLYDESCDMESEIEQNTLLFPTETTNNPKASLNSNSLHHKVNGSLNSEMKIVEDMPLHCTNKELKTLAYEQCCDFKETNKREETCPEENIDKSGSCSVKETDVPNNVERSVKVYTHKKRKSVEKAENIVEDSSNLVTALPPSTDCIDLLEEPSSSNVPVTLLTSLDMESAEYILSLSTENIQSILGCAMSDQNTLIKYKGESTAADDEKLNLVYDKPVLRRSTRLHQQENEEPGNLSIRQIESNKNLKKSSYTKSDSRGKRRAKELDRRVPDENILHRVSPSRRNFSNTRSHRNASKLIVRKHKSLCTGISKEKSEQKSRTGNSKTKLDLSGNVRTLNLPVNKPSNFNVVGYINRALWGDMSDASEELKNEMKISGSSQNTEIPFALGLLPLRTALEKMQATPDYQPRKTRSSVALVKQDHEANGFKRKQCFDVEPKRHNSSNSNNSPRENANTVCHIQIRTAPSRYAKIRKTSHMNNLTSLAVTNG